MATQIYIKFENPSLAGTGTGEHAGEIEVLSWSHGFQGGTHESLSFTKYVDAASTELLKANWTGRQFAKATLRCFRVDGATGNLIEYLSVVMEHVIISNFAVTGGPGNLPVEEVALEYGVVTYHYIEQRLSASLAKEGHRSAPE